MALDDLHFPEHLRYDVRHHWVRTDGDDMVVGVTDFAQSQWGDAGFVQLPAAGERVASGEAVGQVSCARLGPCDVFSPLSGVVIEVNGLVEEDPSLLNADPYGEGWLYRLEPSDPAELRDLLDAGNYRRIIEEGLPGDAAAVLGGVFQHSLDPMLLIDRHRRVLAMNPAAERLTGRDAQSVVGVSQCFHLFRCQTGGTPMHGVDCAGMLSGEPDECGGRFRICAEGGTSHEVTATYSPLPRPDGGHYTLITLHLPRSTDA